MTPTLVTQLLPKFNKQTLCNSLHWSANRNGNSMTLPVSPFPAHLHFRVCMWAELDGAQNKMRQLRSGLLQIKLLMMMMMIMMQRTVYRHKWSPVSCRSGPVQGKFAGKILTYCATQSTCSIMFNDAGEMRWLCSVRLSDATQYERLLVPSWRRQSCGRL